MPGMATTGHAADFPGHRPRRLRRTAALRDLVAETNIGASDLIAPLFVREGIDAPIEIAWLPGVFQDTPRKPAARASPSWRRWASGR